MDSVPNMNINQLKYNSYVLDPELLVKHNLFNCRQVAKWKHQTYVVGHKCDPSFTTIIASYFIVKLLKHHLRIIK